MATDYEKFYQSNPNGLGNPTKEFVDFFNAYEKRGAKVLDMGCGQGRDALFIARLGHSVTGVDLSPTGIRGLKEIANVEGLDIEGIVADIRVYSPTKIYDVVVIDRTLHMLNPHERSTVLRNMLSCVKLGSYILIADEKRHLPSFELVFENSMLNCSKILHSKGFLFLEVL